VADADHRMYRDKASRHGHVAVPRPVAAADLVAPDLFETRRALRSQPIA